MTCTLPAGSSAVTGPIAGTGAASAAGTAISPVSKCGGRDDPQPVYPRESHAPDRIRAGAGVAP